MSFIIYDVVFLAIFAILVGVFFYKRRRQFTIDGPLYLYHTKIGIKIMDRIAKRHPRFLRVLQYLVIASGYILLVVSLWAIIPFIYHYLTSPTLAKAVRVPLIAPLVPYLPEIFNVDFLPPLYFTYWIIILAVIAIPHEFAHGIFARLHNIKVKSTGFGFLRIFKVPTPFLAAFVNPDEKDTNKSSKVAQLSVLAAGTFANVLIAILFIGVMWLFFSAAFAPVGVYYTYATKAVPIENVSLINGVTPRTIDIAALIENSSLVEVTAQNMTYRAVSVLPSSNSSGTAGFVVYDNTPAYEANLTGLISKIDGVEVHSYADLAAAISSKQPGERMSITTVSGETETEYSVTLHERNGRAYLGVALPSGQHSRLLAFLSKITPLINDYFVGVQYRSVLGDFGLFIYYLFWWLVWISISVAIFNMLPAFIFDGGRFFMLTVWGLTGSERAGMYAYKGATWFILGLLLASLVKWVWVVLV